MIYKWEDVQGADSVYAWKFSLPVDAQLAGKEFERLEGKFGALTPETVLDESRNVNAVLHPCFEWNDGIAAEKYRIEQAKYMLRNITVIIETPAIDDNAPRQIVTRAFVDVSEKPKGKYVQIKTALSQENYRQRILKNALAELRMFQNKYQIYAELTGVCKAIDDFAATFDG